MRGNWGSYIQGRENWTSLEVTGIALNEHLGEPVHYPAYDKRLFECTCGVLFPVWAVEAAMNSNDWTDIDKKHEERYPNE